MIGTFHQLELALKPLQNLTSTTNGLKADCPVCLKSGSGDNKKNLEISYSKNMVHCWSCNYHGGLYKAIKDFGFKEYLHLFKFKKNIATEDEEVENKIFELPKYVYNVLNKDQATEYLLSRGLTKEIIREREIKYCYSEKYKDYIIFPSYNNKGSLIGYIAHNFITKKYYILKNVENFICFYESFIDKRSPIILTEGVYDALVVPNAIPLTGLTISQSLLSFLTNTTIILAVDNDVKLQTLKTLIKKVSSVCKEVFLLKIDFKCKDVNDSFLKNKTELINNLKQFYPNESTQ
jgi:DNA primase